MRALPLAFLVLLAGCTVTPRVRTDFDAGANFSTYRTYGWLPVEVPSGMNPIAFRRIRASIDRSLAARGFTQSDKPDFKIGFTVGERDRTEATDYGYWGGGWNRGWGWGGWGWGGWGCCGWGSWGYPYSSIDVYTVTDRSIIIDIYDRKTSNPVWHGVVTRTGYPDDKYDYSKLDASVDAVLNRFPPTQPAQQQGKRASLD